MGIIRKSITCGIGSLDHLETDDLISTLDELMIHMLQLTKENMQDEKERSVPKLHGDLRQSISEAINSSEYDGTRVTIRLGSKLEYAKRVANFETHNVRHAIDPEAVGHYDVHLVNECKFRLGLNWELSKRVISAD